MFDDILKAVDRSRPIDQIFDGKATTDNLYKKALETVKGQKVTIVRNSVEKVIQAISEQSKKSVNGQDIINIIYDSNASKSKLAGIGYNMKKNIGGIATQEEITASYGKLRNTIPSCVSVDILEERKCIKQRVSQQYTMAEENDTDINSFKEENYGEDLYTNGTIDDSSYDILVDIKNIGNLLFTSFISPKETLFYKLPQNRSTATSALFSNILGSVGGNSSNNTENMGTFGNEGAGSNNTGGGTSTNSGSSSTSTNNNGTITDTGIQNFITKTNTTSTTTSTTTTNKNKVNTLGIAQGNICIPSVSAGNTSTSTTITEESTTTIQAYLDDLDKATQGSIPNADYVNQTLIDTNQDTVDEEELALMNQLIENKINGIFDPESTKICTERCADASTAKKKSCEDQNKAKLASCEKMNTVDRSICKINAKTALSTCKEPVIGEETICKIECLCFTIQYPRTQIGLEGLDGQIKLRFCSIPVQQNRISKGKDILGRDDSLSRIKAVFENLLNGGEMVKYQRNKEYLDSPLAAIKWDKIISFDIKIYLKNLFSSVSDKAKKEEKKKITDTTEKDSKGDPKAANRNNINKLRNDLAFERTRNLPSTTPAEAQKQKLEEEAKIKAATPNLQAKKVKDNSKNQKNVIFNEQIGAFLEKNSKIRSNIATEIGGFADLSTALNNTLSSLK